MGSLIYSVSDSFFFLIFTRYTYLSSFGVYLEGTAARSFCYTTRLLYALSISRITQTRVHYRYSF
jgi:hypothetical protein